jgi:subtilisin-like proprotein convertase family protein
VVTEADDVTIKDLATVVSAVTVTGCTGRASRTAEVEVHIRHAYRGSLVVDLVTPTGATLRLKSASVTDMADDINATYKVDASEYDRNGIWKLKVRDIFIGTTGRIDTWTVRL